ncbi:MICOS complex subunit MIC27-like isoform X2 [Leptotrombidium deliense]|uniref:MICOS complex subunit n=1 Tax=Leptotrombidium deliense TaxID=299467 RepID=A0A443SBM2_9ACAR|nr:MICOS complex subunit MIC27-like isoform X2 [Leptotrombidium deliense]
MDETPTGIGEVKKQCCKRKQAVKICKASELPIYGNPHPPNDVFRQPGFLEEQIRSVREAVQPNFKFLEGSVQRSKQIVNTAISHTQSTFDTLRDEKNDIAKATAIASGGLFGLLFSIRKGFFKKVFYTTVGVGTISAVCYPKKSYEMLEVSAYIVRNKGPALIKEYTGLDLESLIPTRKDKISDAKAAAELKAANIAMDRDQSSPEDKSMISNRSSK